MERIDKIISSQGNYSRSDVKKLIQQKRVKIDGKFAHNILAPKKHVSKKYEVIIDIPVTKEMKKGFEEGIELIDGKCKSSSLIITGKYTAEVTLTEGRYHQIKRMFGCYGAKVTKLHRTQMGKLKLPKDLEVGKTRELTPEEMEKLCQTK